MTSLPGCILSGSPHDNGNTAALIHRLYPDIPVVKLFETKIQFCTGCNQCINNRCVIDDGFELLLKSCKPHFVLISPIYFYGFPSFVKAFVDRFQIFWNSKRMENFESAVILLHGESGNKKAESGLQALSEILFQYLGAKNTIFYILHNWNKTISLNDERILWLETKLKTVYSVK